MNACCIITFICVYFLFCVTFNQSKFLYYQFLHSSRKLVWQLPIKWRECNGNDRQKHWSDESITQEWCDFIMILHRIESTQFQVTLSDFAFEGSTIDFFTFTNLFWFWELFVGNRADIRSAHCPIAGRTSEELRNAWYFLSSDSSSFSSFEFSVYILRFKNRNEFQLWVWNWNIV